MSRNSENFDDACIDVRRETNALLSEIFTEQIYRQAVVRLSIGNFSPFGALAQFKMVYGFEIRCPFQCTYVRFSKLHRRYSKDQRITVRSVGNGFRVEYLSREERRWYESFFIRVFHISVHANIRRRVVTRRSKHVRSFFLLFFFFLFKSKTFVRAWAVV